MLPMPVSRRTFLAHSAKGVTAAALLASPLRTLAYKKEKLRIGLIAVGYRGQVHLEELLKRDDVEVVAIADPQRRMVEDALAIVKRSGKKEPVVYANGKDDYKALVRRSDMDAVIVSSPWEWHLPHAVAAMEAGKAVGLEVGGAIQLQDCWDYVRTSERTGMPLMMLESTLR